MTYLSENSFFELNYNLLHRLSNGIFKVHFHTIKSFRDAISSSSVCIFRQKKMNVVWGFVVCVWSHFYNVIFESHGHFFTTKNEKNFLI